MLRDRPIDLGSAEQLLSYHLIAYLNNGIMKNMFHKLVIFFISKVKRGQVHRKASIAGGITLKEECGGYGKY
jgi:hypothetical protein